MKNKEKGSGEVSFIIGVVVYFMFIGWLANALGYSSDVIGPLGSWTIPMVNIDVSTGFWSWISGGAAAILDIAIGIVNIFAWILQMLASFAVLMSFSIRGDVPAWLLGIMFTPVAFGVAWLVLSTVRGRE